MANLIMNGTNVCYIYIYIYVKTSVDFHFNNNYDSCMIFLYMCTTFIVNNSYMH